MAKSAKKADLLREGEYDHDEFNEGSLRAKPCTPEILLKFILKLGHCPTKRECLEEFGAWLGPIMCGHELKEQGKWPKF